MSEIVCGAKKFVLCSKFGPHPGGTCWGQGGPSFYVGTQGGYLVVIDKPQKVELQKIDSMVVLILPGDLMLIEKIKIMRAVLKLPAEQHCQISQFRIEKQIRSFVF